MRPALLVSLITCAFAVAQERAGSNLAFEVASVRPAGAFAPGAGFGVYGGPGTRGPGRITFARSTLADLMAWANDVPVDQISGPGWIRDRGSRTVYKIIANVPPNSTREQCRVMLRNLLAERFHLAFHRETQTRPGYELVVAPGGPKLKEVTAKAAAASTNRPGSGRSVHRQSMAELCRELADNINTSNGTLTAELPRVVDRTGLTGIYEFSLVFSGTYLMAVPVSALAEGSSSIFTAVEKQLGLKLHKVKDVEVDVLVVDSADRVPVRN